MNKDNRNLSSNRKKGSLNDEIIIDGEYHNAFKLSDEKIVAPYPHYFFFPPKEGLFDGIFKQLTDKCKCNPVTLGILSISGNNYSYEYQETLPKILEHDWNGWWFSKDEPNSYITFDFHDHRVNVTGYSIKTYREQKEFRHLKSWVLEGSNGDNWTEIDSESNHKLNGPNSVATFGCGNQKHYFQNLRLRMTGLNHHNDDILVISEFEIFGTYE